MNYIEFHEVNLGVVDSCYRMKGCFKEGGGDKFMSTSMRERESYFLGCDYLFVLQLQMLLYFFFSWTSSPTTFSICFPFSPLFSA